MPKPHPNRTLLQPPAQTPAAPSAPPGCTAPSRTAGGWPATCVLRVTYVRGQVSGASNQEPNPSWAFRASSLFSKSSLLSGKVVKSKECSACPALASHLTHTPNHAPDGNTLTLHNKVTFC